VAGHVRQAEVAPLEPVDQPRATELPAPDHPPPASRSASDLIRSRPSDAPLRGEFRTASA
jgi:hypothetical protein